jgi:hypothetical protein
MDALEGFAPSEQERIIRWVREKIGLVTDTSMLPTGSLVVSGLAHTPSSPAKDLKTFVLEKKPKNDVQCSSRSYESGNQAR